MKMKRESVSSHESQTNLLSRRRGESCSTTESSPWGQTDDNFSNSSSSDITAGSDINEGVPSYPAPPPPRRPRPHAKTMPGCQPIPARNEYISPIDEYEATPSGSVSLSETSVDITLRRRHRSSREDTMQSRRSTANQRVFKRRSLVIVNIVALAFSFSTLIVAILSLLWQIVPNLEAERWSDECLEACLPCKELEEETLIEKLVKTDGGTNCCARTSGQLSEMVLMLMDEAKEITIEQPPPSKYRFSPVSAHVHLYPFGDKRENRGEGKEPNKFHVKLNPDLNVKEHVRGVTLTNNRLKIDHAGMYYIYSSVYFKSAVEKTPCTEDETWHFHVNRHHPNRPSREVSLIKSVYKCSKSLNNEHHTSFSGAVFELIEGDDIFVTVSDERVVSFTGSMSFLGLVMLASG